MIRSRRSIATGSQPPPRAFGGGIAVPVTMAPGVSLPPLADDHIIKEDGDTLLPYFAGEAIDGDEAQRALGAWTDDPRAAKGWTLRDADRAIAENPERYVRCLAVRRAECLR